MDKTGYPKHFLNLEEVVEGIEIELAYATKNNFVGEVIPGYNANIALCTEQAAKALGKVAQDVAKRNLGLKVLDAYRPQRAVDRFLNWAKDDQDTKTKAEYYPKLTKPQLFEQGYLFQRSSHSRGSTIDLTLIDMDKGLELDMGSKFDYFDPISWSDSKEIEVQQQQNRQVLHAAMAKQGFLPIATEWWHFTLAKEPYPDSYFDFVIGD